MGRFILTVSWQCSRSYLRSVHAEREVFISQMFYTDFSLSPSVVNDGGVSWLRKSFQRMKEQADREQRSVESVVAERYGVSKHTHSDKQTHISV